MIESEKTEKEADFESESFGSDSLSSSESLKDEDKDSKLKKSTLRNARKKIKDEVDNISKLELSPQTSKLEGEN